jgi:GTP-binding protein HflX
MTRNGKPGAAGQGVLVGYTNVGKSTLMNLLCKSDLFAENKCLTPGCHRAQSGDRNLPFLLSDTVGLSETPTSHGGIIQIHPG